MILTAYHFDGDPGALVDSHRRMVELFPPNSLDLHLAISHERGLTVYDACPDLATQQAFAASPEFRATLAQVGLPSPTIEVLGEVQYAHLNDDVRR
jgi:hypothetical protein